MSEPRHALVLAVFDAFREAIAERDATKAEARSTSDGWRGRAAGVGRFYRRAARLGQVPEPTEAVSVRDDRAVVRFSDAEGAERFACFVMKDGAWRIHGLATHPVRSALHLSGTLSPLARLDDLEQSERAAAWVRHVVSAGAAWRPEVWPESDSGVRAVESLQGWLSETGARADRVGEWDVPSVERSIAGLRIRRRGSEAVDEVWVVLGWSAAHGRLVVHHLSFNDDIDSALDGVPLSWDGTEVEAELPASEDDEGAEADGFTPRELMALFDATRDAFHKAGGSGIAAEDLDALRRVFAARVYGGTGSGGGLPQLDMTGAVRDYVAAHSDGDDVVIDRAFVSSHASGVLNAMIGAFTKALVPETVQPAPSGRRVTVDVADLVGGLLPEPDDD